MVASPRLLIIVGLMVGSVLTVPLAHAFVRALAFARDPASRVTPADPWVFFEHSYRRKTRWWFLALSALFLPSGALLVGAVISGGDPRQTPGGMWLIVTGAASCLPLYASDCFHFWGFHFRSTLSLCVLSLATAVGLLAFSAVAFPWTLPIACTPVVLQSRLRRLPGWFRFEE